MNIINGRVIYSLLFYILILLLIISIKPKIIFNKDGSLKNFGLEKNQTIYSLGITVIVIAILSFYIFCMLDIMFL